MPSEAGTATAERSDRPLRLLALDGGGVRGLVTLLLLRRLMFLMGHERMKKPCEVFDMIAGTSTGGLIAIMLGRLEMDVDAAIKAYTQLSSSIFVPRLRNRATAKSFPKLIGNSVFDHKKLENAIKIIVKQWAGDEDATLLQQEQRCKVFVCASMQNSNTQRLRSYHSTLEEPIACAIWEAARATSAAPTFFEKITFECGTTFRDGALRDNNPIFQLVDEAKYVFPGQEISTIVSLGTGVSSPIVVGDSLLSSCESMRPNCN